MRRHDIQLVFLVVLLILLSVTINLSSIDNSSVFAKQKIYVPPPKSMKYMTFGYEESFADSLWLRWIQDIDICGKSKVERSQFEEKFSGYKKNSKKVDLNLGFDRNKRKVCEMGWSFQLLDIITDLAPKFRMPYVVGAPTLSVLIDDHEGAKIIFDKGLKQFPWDWKIYYRAAYHYLYELDNLERAAELLNKAGKMGAPWWVQSLAARLYSRAGQYQLGLIVLKQYLKKIEGDEVNSQKIIKRIKGLEAKIKAQK